MLKYELKSPKPVHKPQPLKDFGCGYIAGVVTILTGQPFDICKVRVQSKGNGSFFTALKEVVKNEGVPALWKGSTFPLIAFGVCNAIIFSTNEKCKHWFKRKNKGGQLTPSQLFASGSLAGLANTVISSPMEHIRIRMQIQDSNFNVYRNSFDAACKIFKHHGFQGVYKGFSITLMRELLLNGGYFTAYGVLRQSFTSQSSLWIMTCGGLAGVTSWCLSFAVDNVKSRIQSDAFIGGRYKGALDVLKQSNFKELSRGFTVGFYRSFPVSACTFFAFETALKHLNGRAH